MGVFKAAFIDKDGTIVDNSDYPKIPSDKLLEQDILEGLKYLQNKGYKLIIISNQPWTAKGLISKEQVEVFFKNITNKLKDKEITITDYFYCPHRREENCNCKKPNPGMILKAVKKHNIDLAQSIMIGDRGDDINLGKNLKIKTFLVQTGNGKEFKNTNPDHIIKNINAIGEII